MMNMKKKYLVIGLVVVLVVAALVCAMVFGRGEEPQPTDPTGGTTESTQPGGQTENTQATEDAGGTQVTEPDPTESDPTEPEATEPDATEPDSTEPDSTEPVTEPEETEPAETEPVETEPDSAEPVTEPEETEPAEHVHSFEVLEIEATCEEFGYIMNTCSCGYWYASGGTDALGHDWSDWEITVEPTVTSTGERQRTCSHCGTVTEVVPALNPETGEAYESYIDPRITIKECRAVIGYEFEDLGVNDYRTWGDPPSIWVNDNNTMTVVYFRQDGTRVEVLVEAPPEGYMNCCVIRDDGSYRLTLIGSYGG